MDVQASDHPFGGPLTGAPAFKAGDAREGGDTPGRREPKECERGRAEVLGTFSARAHLGV